MNNSNHLPNLTCKRCGHMWTPRQPKEPKTCPKCRSPYWNKHRKDIEEYVQYLWVIDGIHRTTYDTFHFLATLHEAYFKLPLIGMGKSVFYPKLLLRLRIIEIACQYLEVVASFSIACRETGLLYPQVVLSAGTSEVKDFWDHSAHLTDDDIKMIFNPGHTLTSVETSAIKERYNRIAAFYNRYWSLYNAIKHGIRIYPLEFEPKADPTHQLGDLYLYISWVHVLQGKKNRIETKAKKWDGTKILLSIQKQEKRDDIFPLDDLSEYRTIVNDCFSIINMIIKNNAPDFWGRHDA